MKRIGNAETLTAVYIHTHTHTGSFRENLEYNKIDYKNIKTRNLYNFFALSCEDVIKLACFSYGYYKIVELARRTKKKARRRAVCTSMGFLLKSNNARTQLCSSLFSLCLEGLARILFGFHVLNFQT